MSREDEQRRALESAGLDTLAVRAGQLRSAEGEHAEALHLTSSYVFDSAADAAARFSGDSPGNVYSRYTNPTVRTFEERLAAMEDAEQAVATSSGMAAILSTCMALLKAGDHIVCSRSVFGSTTILFNKYMQRFGVEASYVDLKDVAAWEAAIRPETRLFFMETPSNPLSEIGDIAALSSLARQHEILLAVDNCFCTCALQKPLAFGADLVIYSATKYIDGQGRCLGGAVVGNKALIDEVVGFLRSAGPTMSPFNAWVFLKGLETLRLRMEAHSANAMALAEWLEAHPKVTRVHYAGLSSHPQHALAKKQQSAFGGVLSFEVEGGREQAWQLGDAKTTIVHPGTTTHGRLSEEERAASGIGQNLVRIAVGLESIEDLKADLERGLGAL